MPDKNIGGQAVIEGVMIRAPRRVATACRKPSGEIVLRSEDYLPLVKRIPFLRVPILRGLVAFLEMLVIGLKSLNFSASVAAEAAQKAGRKNPGKKSAADSFLLFSTTVLAFAIAIAVFFYLPLLAANLFGIRRAQWAFNLAAGGIRVSLFIGYVWFLSLFRDFRRVFEYHGAEHMSIFAYENDEELSTANIRKYPPEHPRCGTSFLMIVALGAIIIYSFSDTIFFWVAGRAPSVPQRFLVHFSLLPFVAGSAFELLKLAGKTRENRLTKILIAPGLWLQKITTRMPHDDQIEVAVAALHSAVTAAPASPLPVSQKA